MHNVVLTSVDAHITDVVLIREDHPWLRFVLALAGLLVIFPLVILVVTLAIVPARRVGTMLRAHRRCLGALIDVYASLAVGHEFVAGVAVAVVAGQGVDAFVAALVNFNLGAFVYVTVKGFVTVISAVRHLIAHEVVVNALSVGARELALGTRSVVLLAIGFVTEVTAIVFAVATVLGADAFEVLAGELLRGAGFVLGVAEFSFVRTVAAIVVVITKPALRGEILKLALVV